MENKYSVKINRSEGSLEVQGDDQKWVDAKLEQLQVVYRDLPVVPVIPIASGKAKPAAEARAPKPKTRKKAGRAPGSSTSRPQINDELQNLLTSDVTSKLETYVSERSGAFKKHVAQAAIIATFLQDNINWHGVDQHDLYTVYRTMGLESPSNISSQLINATRRNSYFTGIRDGKFQLSVKGENFARSGSLDAADKATS